MQREVQYRPGHGMVFSMVQSQLAQMLLFSTERLQMDGMCSVQPDCSFPELEYLPKYTRGMTIDGKVITHWEFPNFATLEFKLSDLQGMYIQNRDELLVLGNDPENEIQYIANKSDGYAYNMFSCYAQGWHSFAHYQRRLYYLGDTYRVGHVEVVGTHYVSTHYQGKIFVNHEWRDVSRKPLFSQPDFVRGHTEGIIVMLNGVENRVKIFKTHDLIVTALTEEYVIVETADAIRRLKCPLPKFPLSLGLIVEYQEGHITKIRSDKKRAELVSAYDRIENSLTYSGFKKGFRDGLFQTQSKDRYQVKLEEMIIFDPKLFSSIMNNGSLLSLYHIFPAYPKMAIARTVRASGYFLESVFYSRLHSHSYEEFLEMYQPLRLLETPLIQVNDPVLLREFDFEQELKSVELQERLILQRPEVIRNEIHDDVQVDRAIETAMRVVSEITPKQLSSHTKTCMSQVLKCSYYQCALCMYNSAVKLLVQYVHNYTAHYVETIGMNGLHYRDVSVRDGVNQRVKPKIKYKSNGPDVLNSKILRKTEEELKLILSMTSEEYRLAYGDTPPVYDCQY